jgi:hypothetical protein
MSDAELRLECAKLAAQIVTGPEAMQLARSLYQWVCGSEEPKDGQ